LNSLPELHESGGSKTDLAQPVENIVIAGAGQAGGRAAEALRGHGFRGAITIIGKDPHPPDERPRLSKAMLQWRDVPVTYLKQTRDWTETLNVCLEIGVGAVDCDADPRILSTPASRDFCGRFSIIALHGAEIVGALSVNAAGDMAMFRRIIAANKTVSRRSGIESLRPSGCLEMIARNT
jgi:NADPH-dependent 2,4-dienoyl-CoA reductase/sulfur reductase-like enzyme